MTSRNWHKADTYETVAKFVIIKTLLPTPFPGNVWWWLKYLGVGESHGVEIGGDHRGHRLYVVYWHLGPFTFLSKVICRKERG